MTGQAPAPERSEGPASHQSPQRSPHQSQRIDGWTPERQRGFLERIAEGATVDEATASVGLSPRAAYALRRRAAGAAFALGWDAAKLVARPIVAEALFLRAIAGQVERITKPDGDVIERHRYDNRLAMSLLARLDRHAEDSETTNAAARMIASEFDAFLDLVERDAGPARAGLFIGERLQPNAGSGAGAGEAAMAPILALARADRWLRSGAGLASEIDVTDLDPAARATWTAEQWARAEAAGLLQLAPAPAPKPKPAPSPAPSNAAPASALPALRRENYDIEGHEDRDGDVPVWRDTVKEVWRTCFPPPRGYVGTETGAFGEEDYSRECSDDEAIILDAPYDAEVAERLVVESDDRDAWFVGYAIDGGLVDDAAAEAAGADDAARVAALAWAFDPLRQPDAGEPSSHGAVVPPPKAGGPAPNCPTGRSPRVIPLDGAPP